MVEKGFTSTATSSTATSSLAWLGELHSQLLPVDLGAIGLLDGGVGGALLHEGDEGITLSGVEDLGDGSKLFESFLEGKKKIIDCQTSAKYC